MKYNKEDLYKGMKLKCVYTDIKDWWIVGKTYKIKKREDGLLYITDETNYNWHENVILEALNKECKFKFKEENNMQEFKVGDLVEVIENKSGAYKNKFERFKAGDKAVVTDVLGSNIRIGNDCFGNVIGIKEVKKVEQSPELTEHEEELVLRLAEYIKLKDNRVAELEELKFQIKEAEEDIENKQKQIKEITKKLLTK